MSDCKPKMFEFESEEGGASGRRLKGDIPVVWEGDDGGTILKPFDFYKEI